MFVRRRFACRPRGQAAGASSALCRLFKGWYSQVRWRQLVDNHRKRFVPRRTYKRGVFCFVFMAVHWPVALQTCGEAQRENSAEPHAPGSAVQGAIDMCDDGGLPRCSLTCVGSENGSHLKRDVCRLESGLLPEWQSQQRQHCDGPKATCK